MKFIVNLSVKAKILALLILMSLFLVVVGFEGYYYTGQMSNELRKMYSDNLIPIKSLNETRHNFRAVHGMIMELMFGNVNKAREQELMNEIKAMAAQTDVIIKEYESKDMTSKEKEILAQVKQSIKEYRDERQKAIEMVQAGQKEAGYAYFSAQAAGRLEKVNNGLKQLADINADLSKNADLNGRQQAAASGYIIMTVCAFALLTSISLGWFLAAMIGRRLNLLNNVLHEVANGNLGISEVEIKAQDEIGQIGKGLNLMLRNLRALIKSVAASSDQLAAASEELMASADQTATATNHVAASVVEVSQDAEKQAHMAADTSKTIVQMSEEISKIASNSETVTSVAGKTSQAATDGSKAVESAVSQMSKIEKSVGNSAIVVGKLGERSKEIGSIVDTIAGIAGQTNLLALNAAIEAARAGEQGRGFAVVAEEVRKLAEQSEEAAKQIAGLIREIQGDTSRAVTAMTEGTQDVQTGINIVNGAGTSFNQIVSWVEQVKNQINDMAFAIKKLSNASNQIVATVKEINQISQTTASQTQTVSAATEEQSASIEEIASSSQTLAHMAQELQASIAKFKV